MDRETKYNEYAQDEESLDAIDDEQPMLHDQTSPPKIQSRYTRSLMFLLVSYCVLSTTVILVLVALVLGNLRAAGANKSYNPSSRIFFGRDIDYMSVDTHYDYLWDELSGESLVVNLPDPRFNGDETPTTLAMFHQLHCLSAFRHAIQKGHQGIDPGVDHNDDGHWPHCFDYMRKTILCWADGTNERQPLYQNGTLAEIISGSRDERQCGDSQRLIDIMKDAGSAIRTQPFRSADTLEPFTS